MKTLIDCVECHISYLCVLSITEDERSALVVS
jgi:hypothetical protein